MKRSNPETPASTADVYVQNMGTIWQFEMRTDRAVDWQHEHIDSIPDYMLTDHGFVADWRPARDIANGMMADGLTVYVDSPVPGLAVSK